MLAPPLAEDIPFSRRGTRFRIQGLLEPRMMAGGMVRHDVHHDLDIAGVRGLDHFAEIIHRAQTTVHIAVIVHIISAIEQMGGVERAEPDRIDAQIAQIVHS